MRTRIESTAMPSEVLGQADTAMRRGLERAVGRWHDEMMPGHFETSAPQKYDYQPRSKKYMIYKAKVFKHQRPLVKTSKSERMIKAGKDIQSRRQGDLIITKDRMKAPKHFYQRRGSAPDKPKELTTTISAEQEDLKRTVRVTTFTEMMRTGARRSTKTI